MNVNYSEIITKGNNIKNGPKIDRKISQKIGQTVGGKCEIFEKGFKPKISESNENKLPKLL